MITMSRTCFPFDSFVAGEHPHPVVFSVLATEKVVDALYLLVDEWIEDSENEAPFVELTEDGVNVVWKEEPIEYSQTFRLPSEVAQGGQIGKRERVLRALREGSVNVTSLVSEAFLRGVFGEEGTYVYCESPDGEPVEEEDVLFELKEALKVALSSFLRLLTATYRDSGEKDFLRATFKMGVGVKFSGRVLRFEAYTKGLPKGFCFAPYAVTDGLRTRFRDYARTHDAVEIDDLCSDAELEMAVRTAEVGGEKVLDKALKLFTDH